MHNVGFIQTQELQSVFKTDYVAKTKPMNNPGEEIVIENVITLLWENHSLLVVHNQVT